MDYEFFVAGKRARTKSLHTVRQKLVFLIRFTFLIKIESITCDNILCL